MQTIKISFIVYAVFIVSLFLSACADNTQTRTDNVVSVIKQNAFTTSQLAGVANDSAAHWLTPELLLLPNTINQDRYQLWTYDKAGFKSVPISVISMPN